MSADPINEIWHLLSESGLVTAGISTTVAGLILLWKKGFKPLVNHIKRYRESLDKIDKIFYEITPNGGDSIKDVVNSIREGLAQVNARQRAILADTDDAIFEADASGSCIWVNRTFSRITQRMPTELLGRGWYNAIHEPDRKDVVSAWTTAIEERIELSMSFRFETTAGILTHVRLRSYKMTDLKGEIIGYLISINLLDGNESP